MTAADATLLRVEHLAKTITLHLLGEKRTQPLRDISFYLAEGEFLGVVGPSGAGKSSLLKCIYRTYLPHGGRIDYRAAGGGWVDLAAADDRTALSLRQTELGYVSQFLQAPPRVPAVEVVAQAAVGRGVERAKALEQARELLRELDIGPQLQDSFPALFSGGEQQRINVARALIAPARLLLLDEPTSALDRPNRERVVELLQRARGRGTALLGVFHDQETLRRLADRVLVLESGLVTRQGNPADIDIERYAGAALPEIG